MWDLYSFLYITYSIYFSFYINLNSYTYLLLFYKNIYLLILLFNGNIVLPSRKTKFKLFLDNFNNKIYKGKIKQSSIFPLNEIKLINSNILLSE